MTLPTGWQLLGPAERRLCEHSHQVISFLDPYFNLQGYQWATAETEPEPFIRRKGRITIQTKVDEKAGLAWFIGQKIKAARKSNDWTQEDLARRCGIARANIARLESGRHMPAMATLSRLAHALRLDVPNLLKGPSHVTTNEDLEWLNSGLSEWSSALEKEDK